MFIKFKNPCPSAKNYEYDKNPESLSGALGDVLQVIFKTSGGKSVYAPEDGLITSSLNGLALKHKIKVDGKFVDFTSYLDNFKPNNYLTKGTEVKKGDKIGETIDNEDLIYQLIYYDDNKMGQFNLPTKDFIDGGYEFILGKNDKKNDKKNEINNNPNDILKDIFKIALSPASFVQGAFGWDDKTVKEHLVKENVKNIKRLM